jgi:hypothetical protein
LSPVISRSFLVNHFVIQESITTVSSVTRISRGRPSPFFLLSLFNFSLSRSLITPTYVYQDGNRSIKLC